MKIDIVRPYGDKLESISRALGILSDEKKLLLTIGKRSWFIKRVKFIINK